MKRYFVFCQTDILITEGGEIPCGEFPPIPLQPWHTVTTIEYGGDECAAIRLQSPVIGVSGLKMIPLRQTWGLLSDEDYQLAGKCAELLYWDQNSQYCGVCGGPMKFVSPISKHCTMCGKELWPSLATAIIVRVTRADEVLLVHARNFRGNHYGLVAGFVETGETLEQCVAREVREETGIEIGNIRYFGSQPWPYPCGLMIGFTADYVSGDLSLQRCELTDGGWFRRDHLPEIPNGSSLARILIDDWRGEYGFGADES